MSAVSVGKRTGVLVYIRLAHNEWGNELMERVARAAIADNLRFYDAVAVHVTEHAGWWLEWASFGDERGILCVGTANDGWRPSRDVQAMREELRECSWNSSVHQTRP